MRFLLVAPQYLPTIGGVERYTQSLARQLVRTGHQATVVTSALPGLPAQQTDEDGIEVVRLPARLWLGGRFPVPHRGAAFRQLAAQLFAQPFHYAVINNRFYQLSLWAAKQCSRRGIPALVLDHSTAHLSLGNRFLDVFAAWYEHAAMGRAKRWCKDFYGVSMACNRWLAHYGVKPRGVLYNSVDTGALGAIAQSAPYSFRARFGLEDTAPLVAFSGRFIKEKGVWQLAQAAGLLRRHLPQAAVIMAGEGPELEPLRQSAPEGVFFSGPLPYGENIALLAQANVFCLPTRYAEGFPTAVLEAAALHTCVVTTPAGGSPELISDGESGILLKDADAEAIAGALQRALQNSTWRKTAEENAYQRLCARFTWQATAQQLVNIAQKENTP